MRTYTPDAAYSELMLGAHKALSIEFNNAALINATMAMNYALYKLMLPIDHQMVKEAQAIRMAVFTQWRMHAFMRTIPFPQILY